MTTFQTALTLIPSYLSSFFPPNVGKTQFNQESVWGNYLADAGGNGYGLPNRFMVFFESPWLDDKLKFTQTRFNTRLTMRCFTVNVPDLVFSTLDRDIGGPKRKIPYTSTFGDDISMQFYCSPDIAEFGFFKKWMDQIVDPVSRYASYYDDFAKDTKATLVFIPNQMKEMKDIMDGIAKNKFRGLRFTELYPKSISLNGGTVEWASSSKPTFIRIGFSFREAVDITTYDEKLKSELRDLADIASNPLSSNLTKFMQEQGIDNIASDGSVINTVGSGNGVLDGSEVGQSTLSKGLGNLPGNGEQFADGGAVRTVDLGGLDSLQSSGRGGGGSIPAGSPFANNGGVSIA